MTDTCLFELLDCAAPITTTGVLVLDENSATNLPSPVPGLHIISNRYDIYHQAQGLGWPATFSDFDFSSIAAGSIQHALYRISKEKRVVEHVLQQLWARLECSGCLTIAGFKNEGIKTFARRMSEAWQCDFTLSRGKHHLHLYRFVKTAEPLSMLNTADYETLVPVTQWQGMSLWSKPGIFAWDRLDDGSCFLLDQLPLALAGRETPRRGLDLGCGSGLLSLALLHAGCSEIMATDNNAAALLATRHNLQCNASEQHWQVKPGDIAQGIRFSADLLLCNPPFHQGFAVENTLTGSFLKAAHSLLAPRGQALFVVNSFIPLEKLAAPVFTGVNLMADNRRFKVVQLVR